MAGRRFFGTAVPWEFWPKEKSGWNGSLTLSLDGGDKKDFQVHAGAEI